MAGLVQPTSTAGAGVLLADWEVQSLGADVPLDAPTAGTVTDQNGGSIRIALDSQTQNTLVLPTLVWHLLKVRMIPGVLATGQTVYPDLACTPVVDTDYSYEQNLWLDASIDSMMMADPTLTENGFEWHLGESMLEVYNDVIAGTRGAGINFPRRFTGIPVSQQLQMRFLSHQGFASAIWARYPRFQMFGDAYTAALLAAVGSKLGAWTGPAAQIQINSLRRRILGYGPFVGTFQLPGGVPSFENWPSMPSGYGQSSPVQVYKWARFSRPILDIDTGTSFALTARQQLGGASGNVATREDLGWQFSATPNCVELQYFGRRPSPAAPAPTLSYGAGFFGMTFDAGKHQYPTDTPYGVPCTTTRNPAPFGSEQPNFTGTRFRQWRKWDTAWSNQRSGGSEVIFNEDAAITVTPLKGGTVSGTASADTAGVPRNKVDETAVIGIRYYSGGPTSK